MAKHWQNYIKIDSSVRPIVKARIEQSLNDIEHFQDQEGMELLRAAYHAQGGKIHIVEGLDTAFRLLNNHPTVTVNTALQTDIRVGDTQGRPSLTSALIHELYHAADRTDDIDHAALRSMTRLLEIDPHSKAAGQLKHAVQQYSDAVSLKPAEAITQFLMQPSELPESFLATELGHFQGAAMRLERRTVVAILRQEGVISTKEPEEHQRRYGTATMRYEEDAVSYTDALNAKNYGNAEPQRGRYINQSIVPTADGVIKALSNIPAPLLTGIRYDSTGFEAIPYPEDEIGHLQAPPHVQPSVSRDKSSPTK